MTLSLLLLVTFVTGGIVGAVLGIALHCALIFGRVSEGSREGSREVSRTVSRTVKDALCLLVSASEMYQADRVVRDAREMAIAALEGR